MKLQISQTLLSRLTSELAKAGDVEIGGMLFAEHLGGPEFRLHNFSVQHDGGDQACFTRDPAMHAEHIARFHEETGHDYTRFNYLGEWHSHPSFSVAPSFRDVRQMQKIASDPQHELMQAVLLIARLDGNKLEVAAMYFRKSHRPEGVKLVLTGELPEPAMTETQDANQPAKNEGKP